MNTIRAARPLWFVRHVLPLMHRLRTMDDGHLIDRILPWLGAVLAALALYLAWLPIDDFAQCVVAYSAIIFLLILLRSPHLENLRLIFLLVAGFITLRYFMWRTFYTLGFHDFPSWIASLLLYLAEAYGIVVSLLGIFVNIRPLVRQPVPLPEDTSLWPTVDIFIPSYNEDPSMLEITVAAASHVRYPKDKLRVYLLDDGGTTQKRNDKNPDKARAALERHIELQELVQRYGAHYLTRERNEHAKAGNLNSALNYTQGDLILILDADHVPTIDILEKTVGTFLQDQRMFLVQTPHFFINPDPVEKNLQVFGEMPSENEMFYSVIQHGLDFWGASFFCGSAAVLRRTYLMEVGGISGTSITEDAETALGLHARGYHSAYIGLPMISGLQPETFSGFVIQRVRWAQGMVQIFLLNNPVMKTGLRWWQRVCYFSSSFFWFFSYARMMFLLAPSAYLIFGLQIYKASLLQFMSYAFPHVIAVMLVSDYLFGAVRWAFISELYELLQSLYALPGILKVFLNPRAPTFNVTPKGEQLDTDFISQLSGPFYGIFLLAWISLLCGVFRYVTDPRTRDVTVITMAWCVFNLVLLHAALGALLERRQRRAVPRMPADLDVQLIFAEHGTVAAHIEDLSTTGALITIPRGVFGKTVRLTDTRAELVAFDPVLKSSCQLSIEICSQRSYDQDEDALGIRFVDTTTQQLTRIVMLAHGDSERWLRYRDHRAKPQPLFRSLVFLTRLGIRYSFSHFGSMIRVALEWVRRRALSITRAGVALVVHVQHELFRLK